MLRRVMCLFPLFTLVGCGNPPTVTSVPPAPAIEATQLSPEAARLVAIAQDNSLDPDEQRDAVKALKQLGRDGVPALIQLLPGGYTAISLDAIEALGEIGDPSALPKLREMRRENNVIVPGKINAALSDAIKQLEAKQWEQGGK